VPYNLQSAIAGLKNRFKIFPGKAWPSAKALKFWSCVSGTYEPRQIRKEAAVNKIPACRREAKTERRQRVSVWPVKTEGGARSVIFGIGWGIK